MNKVNYDSLKNEIKLIERSIIGDSMIFSIGELMNMYKDKEIIINPNYQRVFRRTKYQKSSLIESILMFLPLPSIFVAEWEDWKREVIDWLQRLSTIYEFTWLLENTKYNQLNSIEDGLSWTEFIPSLEGLTRDTLPEEYKLRLKRTKMYVNILKNTWKTEAKYDLFQRLNSWWTKLSDQETRNCIMVSKDIEKYDIIMEFANDSYYKDCIWLIPDDLLLEKKDIELVMRYLSIRNYTWSSRKLNVNDLIDEFMYKIFEISEWNWENNNFNQINLHHELSIFKKVFKILSETYSDHAFSPKLENWKYKNQLILPAFDVIAAWLSFYVEKKSSYDISFIKEKIDTMRSSITYQDITKQWNTSWIRLQKSIPYSKNIFNET